MSDSVVGIINGIGYQVSVVVGHIFAFYIISMPLTYTLGVRYGIGV